MQAFLTTMLEYNSMGQIKVWIFWAIKLLYKDLRNKKFKLKIEIAWVFFWIVGKIFSLEMIGKLILV